MNLHAATYIDSDAPIAFIGDVHLNMYTPSSRIDDYAKTCCEKFESLLQVCKLRRVKTVVMTGDVFHQTNQSIPFMFSVFDVLQKFKDEGIKVFSIVGNHDIKNELLDNLERSPLGVCFLSGLIQPLGNLTVTKDNNPICQVIGVHFGEPITQKTLVSSIKSILVAHVFFDMGFDADNLKADDAVKLGHDYYVLGHDHVPYDVETLKSPMPQKVVRPGSFMRASSHEYNVKDRKVWVDIYDPSEDVWLRDSVFIKPGEDVFSSKVTDKVDDAAVEDLTSKFTELVNSLYNYDIVKKVSVYQVLDALTIDIDVKKCIEQYLFANGILRS